MSETAALPQRDGTVAHLRYFAEVTRRMNELKQSMNGLIVYTCDDAVVLLEHDEKQIATLTSQRDMLVKALEEIAEADWPGIPANHRLSKAREVARLALQTKEGV